MVSLERRARRDQALQIVVGRVTLFREAAPVLERQVGAIKGDRIREPDERRDEPLLLGRRVATGGALGSS